MALNPLQTDDFVYLEWDKKRESLLQREVELKEKDGEIFLERKKDERDPSPPLPVDKEAPSQTSFIEEYILRIDRLKLRQIQSPASEITDLWNDLELNRPGKVTVISPGLEVNINSQSEIDVLRVGTITLNGALIYSNNSPKKNLREVLAQLLPLVRSPFGFNRMLNCMTQAVFGHVTRQFLEENSNFHFNHHIVSDPNSKIQIISSDQEIKIINSKCFALLNAETEDRIRYTKIQRVFLLKKEEIEEGIAIASRVWTVFHAFYQTSLHALIAEAEIS